MRCMTAQRSVAPLFPTHPSARKGAFILLITLVCYTQLCVAWGGRFCVSCYNGPGNGLGWFLYFSVVSTLKVGIAAHGRFPACGSPGSAGAAPPASWGRWGCVCSHWGLCCPVSSGKETRSIPADGHRSPRCVSCIVHVILAPCHTVSPSSSMPPICPQSLRRSPASPRQAFGIQTSPRAGEQAPGMGVSRKARIICLLPPVFFAQARSGFSGCSPWLQPRAVAFGNPCCGLDREVLCSVAGSLPVFSRSFQGIRTSGTWGYYKPPHYILPKYI